MFFRGPNIQAHCNEAVLCLNFGTPENNEFSIWDKWKIYFFQLSQYLCTLGYIYISAMKLKYQSEQPNLQQQNIRILL